MKSRLIVISDLFGFKENNWIQNYMAILNDYFEVVFYDALVLAEIKKASKTESELHNAFVNGGIEIAINNLLNLENELVNVLGFSIGGTIGWKAGLKGLKIQRIIGVSSTRLRMETLKPNCKIELFYGEKDSDAPSNNWFQLMELNYTSIRNAAHTFYKEKEHIDIIVNRLI
ncbi:alpha/beta hydrolase [Urechidicola vernalis]|uniref:Alpha/beta hydrolase n=1 Tax=Urechidicola vernalis TaxID=3075600 RepID=A0ABU2Y6G7_9FLAO|nr:alpha/beta hydrolase [Urechidicola sp. P050]MDT0553789.1 alpha/beta hydrolase [Urechidicola sp. P050]